MDQRTLAGLGNIHVGESLHRAGLHPERPAATLAASEVERLARAVEESLRFALEREDGPEPITYVEEGGDNPFLVYARRGEPCPACGSEIERIVQGGRSTFFCATCQPRGARWRPATSGAAAAPPPKKRAPRAAAVKAVRPARPRRPGRRSPR